MSINSRVRPKYQRQKRRGQIPRAGRTSSPVVLFLLILLWSITIGWGLSLVNAQPATQNSTVEAIGTVDPVPANNQLGEQLYLENCASCHIALPPAVLPTQTWQQVLQDSQHYGTQLPPLVDPPRLLVWNYLRTFSRPQAKEEETPYRVDDSRYFTALHPKVKLPRPVQITSCVSCHTGAAEYNFRSLTAEWEDSQ